MKKHFLLFLISAILLTGCGQAARTYVPAVITSSQITLSFVENPIEDTSSDVSIVSEISSAGSSRKSSITSSKADSSKITSVVSRASSQPTTSQQSLSNPVILSVSSSAPSNTSNKEIEVVSLTSPIVRGQTASINIKGKPDVEYTIKVIYKSGPSTAKGLEPKTSELNGLVTWSWKVSSRTTAGDWSIEISGNGASVTVPFIVNE